MTKRSFGSKLSFVRVRAEVRDLYLRWTGQAHIPAGEGDWKFYLKLPPSWADAEDWEARCRTVIEGVYSKWNGGIQYTAEQKISYYVVKAAKFERLDAEAEASRPWERSNCYDVAEDGGFVDADPTAF